MGIVLSGSHSELNGTIIAQSDANSSIYAPLSNKAISRQLFYTLPDSGYSPSSGEFHLWVLLLSPEARNMCWLSLFRFMILKILRLNIRLKCASMFLRWVCREVLPAAPAWRRWGRSISPSTLLSLLSNFHYYLTFQMWLTERLKKSSPWLQVGSDVCVCLFCCSWKIPTQFFEGKCSRFMWRMTHV